jgi:hypothetical protein
VATSATPATNVDSARGTSVPGIRRVVQVFSSRNLDRIVQPGCVDPGNRCHSAAIEYRERQPAHKGGKANLALFLPEQRAGL